MHACRRGGFLGGDHHGYCRLHCLGKEREPSLVTAGHWGTAPEQIQIGSDSGPESGEKIGVILGVFRDNGFLTWI